MIVIYDQEYLNKVKEFAKGAGKEDQLQSQLDYLDKYCGGTTRCTLYPDPAPYSFYFQMEKLRKDKYEYWFNGGVIFHGPHDDGGNGRAPTFSANLTPQDGWSIHT